MSKVLSQELLLYALKKENRGGLRVRFSNLLEPDWKDLIDLVDEFGLGPILYSILGDAQVEIPASVDSIFQKLLLNNTARNLHLTVVFTEIARALQKANIQIVPLKGIYLAGEIYSQPGLRVMGDIDILVRRADLERTTSVVESLGYRPERPYSLDAEYKMFHHLPNYFRKGSPPLEIHFRLLMPMPQFNCDMDALWERAKPQKDNAFTLCPEDMLLYLCAHTAYHHLYVDALKSLVDIHLFLLKFGPQLNWTMMVGRAKEWGMFNSLYLTLRLEEEVTGNVIPENIWPLIQPDHFDERLMDAAKAKFFSHQELSRTIAMVWEKENIFQRFMGVLRRIFLPPHVLAQKYKLHPQSKWLYFYYLVRLKDLLVNYSLDGWALFRGETKTSTRSNADGLLIKYLGWVETR